MKKALSLVIGILFFCSVCHAESIKSRIQRLETELNGLKQDVEVIRNMAGTIIPADLDIDMDGEDPSDPGDIKIVKGTVEVMSSCDATTGWSVQGGGSISLTGTDPHEGTGSISYSIASGATKVLTFTKASGAWDFAGKKYAKVWLKGGVYALQLTDVHLYVGNATYNDHDSGDLGDLPIGVWTEFSFDISAISPANDNNKFSIGITNPSGVSLSIKVDYAYLDPGPSQIKAYDGDRVIGMYPKIYQGTYTGNGSDPQTVTLPRRGHPVAILIHGEAATYGRVYLWLNTMGDNLATYLGAAGASDAGVISEVGDCYFTVSGNYANKDTVVYHYLVLWAD